MNTLNVRESAERYNVPGDTLIAVDRCVKRFSDICKDHGKNLAIVETMMDLINCHVLNYKLNFDALLLTSDNEFAHDMIGIIKNMDRSTGMLQNGFVPINIQR